MVHHPNPRISKTLQTYAVMKKTLVLRQNGISLPPVMERAPVMGWEAQ